MGNGEDKAEFAGLESVLVELLFDAFGGFVADDAELFGNAGVEDLDCLTGDAGDGKAVLVRGWAELGIIAQGFALEEAGRG